jgi:TetR/AcrR family transcriptional regulator, regulator of autoinduction and epiphytic fitness
MNRPQALELPTRRKAVVTRQSPEPSRSPAPAATQPTATSPVATRLSFKQQMLVAREQAIIDAVNRMLADKGFDAMTVDEIAAEVGVAKASLYKHFPSKEDLAAAAMVRVMQEAVAYLDGLNPADAPLLKLKAAATWMMRRKLAGQMPNLPTQNSTLRTVLLSQKDYIDSLMHISDLLGGWIETAQSEGHIRKEVPALVVLYTLYARACDPVLEFLQMGGQHSNDEIIALVLSTCFDGLTA